MKKSTTQYRETFRRHRLLLILPIVIATVIGGWFVLGAPKSYSSSASLWVDNPAPATSSLDNLNPSITPPSQQEQSILTELLATSSFDLEVAHQSQLGKYIASNPTNGFGPSQLLKKLGGGSSPRAEIISDFGPKHVLTSVPGPQVLQITYVGPTPAVAQSTLRALVQVLQEDSLRFVQQHNEAAYTYYESQVKDAAQAVAAARNKESLYLQQHPGAGTGDPTLSALQTAVAAANSQLTQANSNLSAASASDSGATGAQLIDPPNLPLGPTSGKKKDLEGILGGLLAGILISLLGTVAMTRDKRDPWVDELEAARTPMGTELGLVGSSNGGSSNGGSRTTDPLAHPAAGSRRRVIGESSPAGPST